MLLALKGSVVYGLGFRSVNTATNTKIEFAFLLKISSNWQWFVRSMCCGRGEGKAENGSEEIKWHSNGIFFFLPGSMGTHLDRVFSETTNFYFYYYCTLFVTSTPLRSNHSFKSLVYNPPSSTILVAYSFSELLKVSIGLDLDMIQNCWEKQFKNIH